MKKLLLLAVALIAILVACAGGEDASKQGVVISQAHIYLPAAGADGTSASDVAAAFMDIDNYSQNDDHLIGARVDFARAEIHEMIMADGGMKMQKMDAIDIPADSGIQLQAGGYHVMLIGLNGSIKVGDQKIVTLLFEKAGEISVPMLVTAEE